LNIKITGFCPVQQTQYSVLVKYTKIPSLGSPMSQYKKVLEYCEYASKNECSHARMCPVVTKAADHPGY